MGKFLFLSKFSLFDLVYIGFAVRLASEGHWISFVCVNIIGALVSLILERAVKEGE